MLLYRYRSVDSACDEINSCYFCFSSREKLNDPIESYVRVYWKGDKNAWEGLLRYYVYCLHLGLLFLPLKEKKLRFRCSNRSPNKNHKIRIISFSSEFGFVQRARG